MSKKITRKVLLAVFALVLSVVALGTTTYAWFTLGATVQVESFEMNVKGGEGLEVAYVKKSDSTDYRYVSKLTSENIINYLQTDYGYSNWASDFEMDAVTSADGKTFQKLNEDHKLEETSIDAKTYVEFKLKFRTKAADQKLVWNQVSLNSNGVDWAPGVPFIGIGGSEVGTSTTDKYYAKNGTRVSVEGEGATAPVVYELPAESGANAVLSNNAPNWTQGAHDFYKEVLGHDLSTTIGTATAAQTITDVTNVDIVEFGAETNGYHYAEVTVRIYLEGLDSETFNAILTDKIQVALGFTIANI